MNFNDFYLLLLHHREVGNKGITVHSPDKKETDRERMRVGVEGRLLYSMHPFIDASVQKIETKNLETET